MSEETPPDIETAAGISAAVGQFAALAASGSFAVNDHGGQALLKAVREMLTWIDGERRNFERLLQIPKLGSSNNAEVMKPFMQKVAGDESGFITQVLLLGDSLAAAEQAIVQAMASYQKADEHATNLLGGR
ncbi:hypothetical protein [Actinokineospora diospyrosa]|uniref:Type VII secretion system (Wss) protein ESAT-6 n=1 Tax=Actinokineospora diospyrosa TaxID=103728 RepID=A0ABT1IJX0_9PSEU|nr:hypothetical protein [Actinokineospora diospyrosa]MCP2272955.1 hypothetical protein [Actinokineospora diospyrosa]